MHVAVIGTCTIGASWTAFSCRAVGGLTWTVVESQKACQLSDTAMSKLLGSRPNFAHWHLSH
jgi:3-hydroxyacyl-CoA dehydrogenase